MIRTARVDDAAAIQAIYAPHVTDGAATFEIEVPSAADVRNRMLHCAPVYPWLVLEQGGAVQGYAYAGRYRERAAYDWIVEISVYVAAAALRRGVARRLCTALLEVLVMQGFTRAVGVITLPGTASVALHEALGFRAAGTWHAAGYKLGRWHDVGVWERALATPDQPPLPPQPFARLLGSSALEDCLRRVER